MDARLSRTDAEMTEGERLIIAKIDGRFTLFGVPRLPLNTPHFFIRAGDAIEGPMTFQECRDRLPDHLDADDCRLVERLTE
jgi:hypothetical protein